jgi:rhodanese-related sulfurtransferase
MSTVPPFDQPEVSAVDIAEVREIRLIDVRATDERYGDIGFIPGSRCFPLETLEDSRQVLLEEYALHQPIVTVCLSGRRSQTARDILRGWGFQKVTSLNAGVLGWRAADLPTCGVNPDPDGPRASSLDELPGLIRACFVAESVEATLSGRADENFDPVGVLQRIIDEETERAGGLNDEAIMHILERLAEIARFRGHPLENIARNVDHLRGVLDDLS